MRIVVNDIAASGGGALTVLKEFYDCVRENDQNNEWIFLLGDHLLEEKDNIKIIVRQDIKKSRFKKLVFDFITGKKYIQDLQPDVVVSLQNIITFGLRVPQIVYIHQSIPFQKIKKFSFFKGSERKFAVYQYLIGAIIKWSAKRSQKVIVQTEWMREAVCESCHLPLEKVVKAMPNVKSITCQVNQGDFRKNSFFYPTSTGIYKNNAAIFCASQILEHKGIDHEITLTLSEEESCGSVKCIGRIPYEQVVKNYCNSTLVFPSYIETFGYPLAEAKKVGTVILAADTSFSREVLEGYQNAYFFDPFKAEELAVLMQKVILGEIMRKDIFNDGDCEPNSWLKVQSVIVNQGEE